MAGLKNTVLQETIADLGKAGTLDAEMRQQLLIGRRVGTLVCEGNHVALACIQRAQEVFVKRIGFVWTCTFSNSALEERKESRMV